jgi:hypothetical protein
MNDLEKYFRDNNQRLIHKWHHYFHAYDNHFSRFRGKDVVILEIGVSQGGSLQMWREYFGAKAKIYGIDIDPRCKQFEEENVSIFIGSQSDREFLREIKKKVPEIDILIDDGGHTMKQQIVSFEELFGHVKENGVYLCEDCHTSYWWPYGGGFRRKGTFIEYSKRWIDMLNAYHSRSRGLKVNEFTKTVRSIHYYDSIVVLEKALNPPPVATMTGKSSFSYDTRKKRDISSLLTKLLNKISAMLRLPYHKD